MNQAIDWLSLPIKERPRLVCLYFNEPDHAGHVYGADSKEVNEQIVISDQILSYLLDSLKKLDIYNNINIVIVSDHGMVDVSEDRLINIDEFNLPGVLDGKGPIMSLKDKEKNRNLNDDIKIASFIESLNIPHVSIEPAIDNSKLHYNNDFFDYLLIAEEGWMIYTKEHLERYENKLPIVGMHGYVSDNMNMHAIFYAYGSQFKKGMNIDTFELIHIYPLLCELLNIPPYKDIDGKLDVLKNILK